MHWDGLSWFYSFSAFYLKHLKNPLKKSQIFCSFFNICCIYKMIPLKLSPALSAKCDEMFKKNFHKKVYWSYLWRVCIAFHLPSVSGGGKPKKKEKKNLACMEKERYSIWAESRRQKEIEKWFGRFSVLYLKMVQGVKKEDAERCQDNCHWYIWEDLAFWEANW